MPYVSKDRRYFLDHGLDTPQTKGELNYVITRRLITYAAEHGMSYDVLSDAKNAAKDAADEWNRRVLGPYEDGKIRDNGDVYPPELLASGSA